jgi:hypothetical protein
VSATSNRPVRPSGKVARTIWPSSHGQPVSRLHPGPPLNLKVGSRDEAALRLLARRYRQLDVEAVDLIRHRHNPGRRRMPSASPSHRTPVPTSSVADLAAKDRTAPAPRARAGPPRPNRDFDRPLVGGAPCITAPSVVPSGDDEAGRDRSATAVVRAEDRVAASAWLDGSALPFGLSSGFEAGDGISRSVPGRGRRPLRMLKRTRPAGRRDYRMVPSKLALSYRWEASAW